MTSPIVPALGNYYAWGFKEVLGPLSKCAILYRADILNHFLDPDPGGGFTSETAAWRFHN
jgi:hypothetical protein